MRKKFLTWMLLASTTIIAPACAQSSGESEQGGTSTVYFTSRIDAQALVDIYNALGVTATGNVAVKISTGEAGGHNYLSPTLIADLVKQVNGTIVECNTAYGGSRSTTARHLQVAADHGFTAIADVDIMDSEGEMQIPVSDTKYLQYNIVGSHLQNYNFMINLAHFKGHAMGGFGGVLKNQSIGVASSSGKCYIHSAGKSTTNAWGNSDQDSFLESMAAAAKSVADYFGEGKIVYINVMNNLSVDCDCDSNPADPEMNDIGILASTDPVALDRACLDLVFNHESVEGDDASPLINRINSLHGTHTVEYAAEIGMGNTSYNLIDIDNPSGINGVKANTAQRYNVFSIDGTKLLTNAQSLDGLASGVYIVNGQKMVIEQ